jgi:hypothetical protein
MGSQPLEKPAQPPVAQPKLSFRSPADLPLLYANQCTVNFTGFEFYVTVYRAAPEPWNAGEPLPSNIDAVPIVRFAVSPLAWLAMVEAFSRQIQQLHADGQISDEHLATARKALEGSPPSK